MKKNAFVRFYHRDAHYFTIKIRLDYSTSLYHIT